MKLLQLILSLITLPLLFVITSVNTEYIFQSSLSHIYVIVYFAYLLLSFVGMIFFKRIKISNTALKQELFSSIQFIFYTTLLVLPGVWLTHYFILGTLWGTGLYLRAYGKVAFVYLVLALSISPLLAFSKNKKLVETLIVFRKIIGILSFLFFLKHGLEYFSMEYLFAAKHSPVINYRSYLWQNFLLRRDALTGVIAGAFMLILGITSNKFSIQFLSGSLRKKIQSLAYPAFLLVAIHIAFSSRFDSFYIMLTIWLVLLRTLSYLAQKDVVRSWPTTKYICTPCGYIYDEALGDPDGWLAPGTKFEDIPDDRACPVCGVTKTSFEPYYDTPNALFTGHIVKVVQHLMLTKDVLELTLQSDSPLSVLPGQYVLLTLKDFDGEFTRSYSVVEQTWTRLKLWIKIKDTGRGGRTLQKLKVWDTLKVTGVHGKFVLQSTSSPKVFVGTGTGISPLYNMILQSTSAQKTLLWGLAMQEDIYYLDQLRSCSWLQTEIYLSKEEVQWYHYGRMDVLSYKFSLDTEFYLCGNPAMVVEQSKILKGAGYTHVYAEVF